MIQHESSEDAPLDRPLRILVIYSQTVLWSMGEGKGAVSFTRTLESLAARGHEVRLSLPAEEGGGSMVETYRGFFLDRAPAPGGQCARRDAALPTGVRRTGCDLLSHPGYRRRYREAPAGRWDKVCA